MSPEVKELVCCAEMESVKHFSALPLKFWREQVISSHTLWRINDLSISGLKLIHVCKRGPRRHLLTPLCNLQIEISHSLIEIYRYVYSVKYGGPLIVSITVLEFGIDKCWLAHVKEIYNLNIGYLIRKKSIHWFNIIPPPLGAGGIMFSGCPSVHPSIRPFVRSLK